MTTSTTPASGRPPDPGRRRPPARRATSTAVKVGVVIALAALLVYRLKFAPAAVSTNFVTRGPIAAEVMGTGTLQARLEATIGPKIQGRLATVLVDQNDTVQAGQVLARLDDAEWKEQVAVARAGLEATLATVERVRADDARARAVLQQAQLAHERAQDLRKANVAAQSDLDKAVENLAIADSDLKRARAAITEAERQRVTAEKNLAYHEARLADTQLISPFDGLIVRRDRDPGDVVVPGGSVFRLIATNQMWVSAWVDETAMAALAAGQKARVLFRSEPARIYSGLVARLGREADRETREFLVDVLVHELPAHWAVGQRAEVYIATASRAAALLLPKPSLVWRDGQPGVFVPARGRAQWKAVTVGLIGRDQIEVRDGLNEGDSVIQPVDHRRGSLRDGQRVKVP